MMRIAHSIGRDVWIVQQVWGTKGSLEVTQDKEGARSKGVFQSASDCRHSGSSQTLFVGCLPSTLGHSRGQPSLCGPDASDGSAEACNA